MTCLTMRLIDTIVECKVLITGFILLKFTRLIDTIVECKVTLMDAERQADLGLIDTIVECKEICRGKNPSERS